MARDSLDANLIIHYILNDNPKQAEKVRKLLEKPSTTHYLSILAVAEAVHVFSKYYEQKREEIAFNMQSFLQRFDDVLEYDKEVYELAFPYYVKYPALSFEDCCMAYIAELEHAEPLFTFDKQLAKKHPSAKLL